MNERNKYLDQYMKDLKNKADKGSIPSQAALGCLYFSKDDYENSFKYLTLAAEKRAPRAMHYLGRLYEGGFGVVNIDLEKAKELYINALSNEWTANIDLARLYRKENNVKKAKKHYEDFLNGCPFIKEIRESQEYLSSSD